MAAGFTTTTTVGGVGSHIIPPFYSDFMRENLYPNMYFRQLGTRVTVPQGYGDTIRIPRWDTPIQNSRGQASLVSAVTAVAQVTAEGGIIDVFPLSAESITGDVVQFAGARGYTDKLIITAKANFLEGALESLSRELTWRIDNYTRTQIDTNAWNVAARESGGGGALTTDGLFGKNVAKIAPYLDSMSVPRWDDQTFVSVSNPLAQYDIFRDPSSAGFVPVARYGDVDRIYRGEVGQKFGIRFLLSNTVPIVRGAGGANSGAGKLSAGETGSFSYIFAPDAFYSIELEKGGVEVIHQPLGSGGATGDPGAQRGSIAVKVFYGVAAAPAADNRLMKFAHGINLHF